MLCPDMKTFQQLTVITQRLVNTILVDQIYFSQYEFQGICHQEFIILLPHTNKQFITEAKPLVGTVMSMYSHFRHKLYYANEVRHSIRKGGISFFFRCQPDNLLYINSKSNYVALSSKLSPERVFKRANEALEMEKQKIKAFSDGAQFYLDKGNYQLCAFMLHQVFELCYRMVEIVIFGKEKLSHSIRNHHQIALAYLPQLKLVFDRNDEIDMTIMELLDSAYLSVRYENGYYITERQLLYLVDKSQTIQEMVEEACADMLEAFGATLGTVTN